ncbi:MAG: ATP-binding domain-containing protein [Parabacteroides sp.]|nr:ATP-binding domain-containing protein [Parabacteroides sp.]
MAKKDWMIKESELDEDQIQVLMATHEKSCVVTGCAGSGKSALALIKAGRIQKEKGNNYKIIVFTKALCRYMNAGKEALKLTNDFFYYWDWKNHYNAPSADYIIVDEIQDFTKEEIEEFISASEKAFFFFGDTAQSIYGGFKTTFPVEKIQNLVPQNKRFKTFDLYRNYRLPIPVARLVQYIGIDLDGYDENIYKSRENQIPKLLQYENIEEQAKSIVEIIKRYSLTDVGILLPYNDDVLIFHRLFNEYGLNHEIKYEDKQCWTNRIDSLNFTTENPKVMTYHSAKGLQFETVFIPNIRELNMLRMEQEQKALYVAMTRTYRDLYIMYSGNLPSHLSESVIPKELYETSLTKEIVDF